MRAGSKDTTGGHDGLEGPWPDHRTARVRGAAKLVELAIGFSFIGVFWFLAVQAIEALQAGRCPSSSFAFGASRVAGIFIMVAPGFAAIAPGLMAANVATGLLAVTRRFFDGDVDYRKSRRFRADQARMGVAALALACGGLLVSFIASQAQFCLTPRAILYRPEPWAQMRAYPWSEVRSITTSCQRGSKGSWSVGYELGLADGRSLDIRGGNGNAWRRYPQVLRALHPVALQFDASRVAADCAAVDAEVLRRRP